MGEDSISIDDARATSQARCNRFNVIRRRANAAARHSSKDRTVTSTEADGDSRFDVFVRRCRPGFFNLDQINPDGCTRCFCYGHASTCQSAPNYYYNPIRSAFAQGTPRTVVLAVLLRNKPLSLSGVDGWRAVNQTGHEAPVYSDTGSYIYVQSLPGQDLTFEAPGESLACRPFPALLTIIVGDRSLSSLSGRSNAVLQSVPDFSVDPTCTRECQSNVHARRCGHRGRERNENWRGDLRRISTDHSIRGTVNLSIQVRLQVLEYGWHCVSRRSD